MWWISLQGIFLMISMYSVIKGALASGEYKMIKGLPLIYIYILLTSLSDWHLFARTSKFRFNHWMVETLAVYAGSFYVFYCTGMKKVQCRSLVMFIIDKVRFIHPYLTTDVAQTLNQVLLSKIDYGNTLLVGLPVYPINRLQQPKYVRKTSLL